MSTLPRLTRRQTLQLAGAGMVAGASAAPAVSQAAAAAGTPVTPDLADATATLAVPRRFETASTPFGRVGLLPGEDLLMPGLVRATVHAGAELLLAPFSAAPPGTAAGRWNCRPRSAMRTGARWRGRAATAGRATAT